MSKYDVIPPDVKEYYREQLEKTGIRRVTGHYPVLKTREAVDKYINMVIKVFDEEFGKEGEDD